MVCGLFPLSQSVPFKAFARREASKRAGLCVHADDDAEKCRVKVVRVGKRGQRLGKGSPTSRGVGGSVVRRRGHGWREDWDVFRSWGG